MWLARDENGLLFMFKNRPKRNREKGVFYNENNPTDWLRMDSNHFPSVTYENSPQECHVELD